MEHENNVPDTLSRRRAIAEMLGIPVVLLGIASPSLIRPLEVSTDSALGLHVFAVDQETIAQYQRLLQMYWQLHYTGSAENVLSDVALNIKKLAVLLPYAGSLQMDVVKMLVGFYELASRVSSDLLLPDSVGYLEQASTYIDTNNVELNGRLLYKKGLALYEAGNFVEAQKVLSEAYEIASRMSLPLQGSVILQFALVKSYTSTTYTDRTGVVQLFEQVGSIVRSPFCTEVEGIRLDEPRFLTAYAEGLINLRHYADADDILDKAEQQTSPHLTKRLLFVDIQKLRLYTARKAYSVANELAATSLIKAYAVKSKFSERNILAIKQTIPGKR